MLSAYLTVSLYFLILSLPVSQAQNVTLSVEDGAGVKGSVCCNPNYPDSNRVELRLINPDDDVSLLSVDICGLGTNLLLSGFEIDPRAEDLDYAITQVSDCIEVDFYFTPGFYITQGSGTILTSSQGECVSEP